MLGILYLFFCFTIGYVICKNAFKGLADMMKTTYRGKDLNVHRFFLLVPAWYFTGTLFMTVTTYFVGYMFKKAEKPLYAANIIVMMAALIISLSGILLAAKKKRRSAFIKADAKSTIKEHMPEILYLILSAALAFVLMWRTFYVADGSLKVGLSVFSDFSPHLLMIRSFSYGNNFPTSYGHYAGEDIRYHFMFQFLVGNLEFLGLRIDYAFNIPSILSLVSTFSLLYVLAVKITGSRCAAWLAGIFFAFRSSPSLFKYMADLPKGKVMKTLLENTEFIGETVNEGWGLWNLNVYVNQRHFAFSLAIMLFMLIIFMPLLYKQADRITRFIGDKVHFNSTKSGQGYKSQCKKDLSFVSAIFKQSFLLKEAWIYDSRKAEIKLQLVEKIVLGIILGLSAFFNGAVLICTLLILFFMAAFSDERIYYLITAVIAAVLSLLQSGFFVNGSAAILKYEFGFITPNKTFFGVLEYVVELTGILFFVIIIAVIRQKYVERYLIFAFMVPFIAAFVISLTPDVTVNHKNIMLSIMLISIFNAWLIDWLIYKKGIIIKFVAAAAILLLTVTGIYDFYVVLNRNSDDRNLSFDMNSDITLWVKENASSDDIFLTHNYSLHELVLGGGMLFHGWQYYAWSAGYDTDLRDKKVRDIYSADSIEELQALITDNNIRYIVIDYNNRISPEYNLNESLIKSAYELVFTRGFGEQSFNIYDTILKTATNFID